MTWFSPKPAVNTMASTPFMAAANAPIYFTIWYTSISCAKTALGLPSTTACATSRASLDTPETPSKPDFLFKILSISFGVKFSFSIIKVTTEGSSVPERVPIIKPSNGVNPIVVSKTRPSCTAVMEEPLPKWQVISFNLSIGFPIISAQRWLTYLWEVPWKP